MVLSRLYEEIDNDDDTEFCHLRGTKDLLCSDAIQNLASKGGLAEAASWVHLRQAIYVSIIRKEPIQIPLETFKLFTAFWHQDETALANRIVYLFASTLNEFFDDSTQLDGSGQSQHGRRSSSRTIDSWTKLEQDVDDWERNMPKSFEPLYTPSQIDISDKLEDIESLPCILMMSTTAGMSSPRNATSRKG